MRLRDLLSLPTWTDGVRVGRRPILCAWCDREATHSWRVPQGGREWSCPHHKGYAKDYGATARRIGG